MSYAGSGRKSSGGGYDYGGDYFESVTGNTREQREKWRENYNGGKAAGDLTGNVQRQHDERYAPQRAARERAEAAQRRPPMQGPAAGQVHAPPGAPVTAGPGSPAAVKGVGGTLAIGPGGAPPSKGPLKPKLKSNVTKVIFGNEVHPNPWFSDYEDLETRYGEIVGNIAGLATLAADFLETNNVNHGDGLLQSVGRGPGFASGLESWWQEANSPFGPDHPIPGFDRGGF